MTVILASRRLLLRELHRDDLDFVARMLGDERVMRFYPQTVSRSEAARWIERQLTRYDADGHGLWLAKSRTSGQPIGQIGVLQQRLEEEELRALEVSYLLDHRYWGQGFATEGAATCVGWAFRQLGTDRVVSLIQPENVPSRRVAERNGFRRGRSIIHAELAHDVWELDRETWERRGGSVSPAIGPAISTDEESTTGGP